MVLPGQTLYDVLPPSGLSAAKAGQATPGDPGSQPLVSPADAPDMTPDPNLPSVSASSGGSTTAGVIGCWRAGLRASESGALLNGDSGPGGSEPTPASSTYLVPG